MADSNHPKQGPVSLGALGGVIALTAGLLGFWDYAVPSVTQNLCVDVEEGMSDLYVAALALLGGIMTLYGRVVGLR